MKITFICTGNTCRSPMAQALFQDILNKKKIDDIFVDSCGLNCNYGGAMAQFTSKIIEEKSIFFTHTTQPITQKIVDESDYLITMTKWQKEFLQKSGITSKLYCIDDISQSGDIQDPYGGDINAYRVVANQLEKALCDIFDFVITK